MFFGVGGLARCGLYDMEVNKSLHNFHYGTFVLCWACREFYKPFLIPFLIFKEVYMAYRYRSRRRRFGRRRRSRRIYARRGGIRM